MVEPPVVRAPGRFDAGQKTPPIVPPTSHVAAVCPVRPGDGQSFRPGTNESSGAVRRAYLRLSIVRTMRHTDDLKECRIPPRSDGEVTCARISQFASAPAPWRCPARRQPSTDSPRLLRPTP